MYRRILDGFLNKPFVQRRYVLTSVLQYARDRGLLSLLAGGISTVRQHGVKTFTDTRHILLVKSGLRLSREFLKKSLAFTGNADENTVLADLKQWTAFPTISVIFPTYNTRPDLLIRAIGSVAGQWYPHWELCIVDDCSTLTATRETLAAYAGDPRIHIRYLDANSGISEASNRAIEMTQYDFIALMDHDDELTPDALYWVARELNTHPGTDIIYTDECKVDDTGALSDVFHKPDWSPETLFNGMYTGHLTVYRKSFLDKEVGYFRKAYDFSQDYDLMLRASEKTNAIRHIQRVLYKWGITAGSASQGEKPYARASNIAALQDALRRRSISGEAVALPEANRVKVHFDRSTTVTVIVPVTRAAPSIATGPATSPAAGASALPYTPTALNAALQYLAGHTDYPAYRILVVASAAFLQSVGPLPGPIECITCPDDAHWAEAAELGVRHANSEILVFYNGLLRPDAPGWLDDLVEGLFLPGVGAVSPRLNDERGRIRYAGGATGVKQLIGPTFSSLRKDVSFYFHLPRWLRDVSTLSEACLAVRAGTYHQTKGFDRHYNSALYAVGDLSFRIQETGLRCLYTPYAQLSFHPVPISPAATAVGESEYLSGKWPSYLKEDPYFTGPMRALLYEE